MYYSIYQALMLWDELRDCLSGINRFGGNEAQIYAHTLMPYSYAPTFNTLECHNAAKALVEIVEIFLQKHQLSSAGATIDGLPPEVWQRLKGREFSHRAIVSITKP